jgi:NADH dehydrogenase
VLPGVQFHRCDPYDSNHLAQALEGCDALVNLVGILNEAGVRGRGFEQAHVELTRSVIAACDAAGIDRLVQVSSLNAGKGTSHYLRTKGQAEALIRDSGLNWTILQPSVVFGPGDNFFNQFALLLRLGLVWLPLAGAKARLQPVYVGDLARAVHAALCDTDSIGQTYEIGGPKVYTLQQLVCYVRDLIGLRRWVPGMPHWMAKLQALAFDLIPWSGKPFSSDNLRSLELDSITESDGLAALGIRATPVEAVVPRYLGNGSRAARYQAFRRLAGRDPS